MKRFVFIFGLYLVMSYDSNERFSSIFKFESKFSKMYFQIFTYFLFIVAPIAFKLFLALKKRSQYHFKFELFQALKIKMAKIDRFNEIELSRTQKNYRDLANTQIISNKDEIKRRGLQRNLDFARHELDDLNTDIKVALNKNHVSRHESHMQQLEKHVNKQEEIDEKTRMLQLEIRHLETQIKRVDQEKTALSKQSYSDTEYTMRIRKARKLVELLENRLDISKRREGTLAQTNTKLQTMIDELTFDRSVFNTLWIATVNRLYQDKKMLVDMIDQAVLAFNNGTEMCRRIDFILKRAANEKRSNVNEMTDLIRRLHLDERKQMFFQNKGQMIKIQDLDAKERKRRDLVMSELREKKDLYQNRLGDVKRICEEANINAVIEKFKKHKREFFSHFTYLNEINYYVNAMNDLLNQTDTKVRTASTTTETEQQKNKNLDILKNQLNDEKYSNQQLKNKLDEFNEEIGAYFEQVGSIYESLKCDGDEQLILDEKPVGPLNFDKYLSVIEARLKKIISFVYTVEREDEEKSVEDYVVRDVEIARKMSDITESVDSIEHQCPECAEAEDFNAQDIEKPMESKEIREKVKEKALMPEMQYRMHSISKCQLPVSRALLSKKYK